MVLEIRWGNPETPARRDRSEGVRPYLALVAGYFPAAVAFGVIADGAGLSTPEALLVSG